MRKNVANRLAEVNGWDWHKSRLGQLLADLPQEGGQQLLRMEPQVREEPQLRRLVVDLCEKWRRLIRY